MITTTLEEKDGGNTMPKWIDLGAGDVNDGESSPDGYLKQDVDPNIKGLDIVCDIMDIDKHVELGSCDKVRASHVIEHFPTNDVPRLLRKINSILKPGGELEIIVPNFKWHAQLTLSGQEEQAVYYCFGGQLDEWDFHKTGFTPNILSKRLSEAGFTVTELLDESSITCISQKI